MILVNNIFYILAVLSIKDRNSVVILVKRIKTFEGFKVLFKNNKAVISEKYLIFISSIKKTL